ncbi:MAG: folate-binding protein [Acidobacteriia bacterium]|nr:folate-binding protein [Terriglobia bacterium]
MSGTMAQTFLYQRLASAGIPLGDYNGAETALEFTGAAAELGAMLGGCALLDLGWRGKIIVTGNDRVRWMNGMVTNTVKDLPLNHGNYSFLLNAQGRILADMYIYNRGEYLLIDTDRSQCEAVLKTLDHFIIMDDVELSDSSEALGALGLCGPQAEKTLAAAGIDVTGIEPLEIRDLVVESTGISVVRGPQEKPGWYEIWASGENLSALWELFQKTGAQPAGVLAVEQWRILQGIPRYGQDIRQKDLPQETEQAQALNFSKGCYIGQEIVERIRSRGQVHRKFTGFEFQNGLPEPGKIEAEGRVVAEITSVAEVGGKKIGLGYVRRETGLPGSQINLNGKAATVADLPFRISTN